jgi:sugar transferase (PEP-CTERM/EpsH1 system associated)
MKPLRILHVVESFGVGGGIENGIGNLIQRLDPDRFEHVLCAVFRMGPQIERYPAGRVRLVCLEQSPKRFSIQAPELARLIREVKPAVVHSRNWGALEAVMAGRWVGGCRLIHSEHGLESTGLEPARRRWMRRIAFGLADRVFAVSEELRVRLARQTGFPVDRMSVIHNGVDTNLFRPDPDAGRRWRQQRGIAREEFCIGSVGRLNRVKDYATLLRAAELFPGALGRWRILIAGDGPDMAELTEWVRARPALENRVVFLGRHPEVRGLLNALDVYVLPSIREGISNSLLEAMATGLAAVATDTGGNPEVAVHGESGVLFPVGDSQSLVQSLIQLQSQTEYRERLGVQARQRVEKHFSLDGMISQYEDLYLSLSDQGAARPADERNYAGSRGPALAEKQQG